MPTSLPDSALDQLFRSARTVHGFTAAPVDDATLHALFDLLKWGPTAFNAQPARFVFVRSDQAKQRLAKALSKANQNQTAAAPVTVIVATDRHFQQQLPQQFPAYDAKALFDGNPALAEQTAFRNGSLQGAYLIVAARALGLDAGPMSGFDGKALDAEFFPDGRWQSNFLVNLGVADHSATLPRGPRLSFEQAAQIL